MTVCNKRWKFTVSQRYHRLLCVVWCGEDFFEKLHHTHRDRRLLFCPCAQGGHFCFCLFLCFNKTQPRTTPTTIIFTSSKDFDGHVAQSYRQRRRDERTRSCSHPQIVPPEILHRNAFPQGIEAGRDAAHYDCHPVRLRDTSPGLNDRRHLRWFRTVAPTAW